MAFHVHRDVSWQAGEGTPDKYAFSLDADVDVVSLSDNVATISVVGTVTVTNHPYDSRNSWAASDFAVLVPGDVNTQSHPFVYGTSYYQHSLPFLPDPQNGDASKMLVQFRGDTWRSDPNNNSNKISLWTKNGGLVCDAADTEASYSYPLNTQFNITVNPVGNTTILAWDSSGANSSTDYNWLDRQVWASWFDLRWEARIHLDANGGSGAPGDVTSLSVNSTQTLTVPSGSPTWGQYEFLGWSRTRYTDSRTESDVEFRAGDTIVIQKSAPTVTLYAVWRMDYRPHAILGSDRKWHSHNRPSGTCHVLAGQSWQECRTIGAPTAMGNPPSVRHDGKWYNGNRIGLGGA